MAATSRRNMEILLTGLTVPSLSTLRSSGHVVTVELIWPRPLIALRTAVKTVRLAKGQACNDNWQWLDQILFKETVEERFGLTIKVSESMTATRLDEFARYVAASFFGMAGDVADDMVPGYGGKLAAKPFEFQEKQLKKTKDPTVIVAGGIDLHPSDFTPGEIFAREIPLRSERNVFRTQGHRQARSAPARRELILTKEAPDGVAKVNIRTF